ncbi:tRNA preQ1(34) S-adenosylmethionine ribosyltransferase-isomerase QueA [soil metagenome]
MTSSPDLTRASTYDYHLPPELVARYPAERRDGSRLLVVPSEPGAGAGRTLEHRSFPDLLDYLAPGDLLVLNESRVLPVRLLGHKPTGAACEVFLLRPVGGPDGTGEDLLRWEALVRPGSKLKPGRRVVVAAGELEVVIEDALPDGGRIVRLETPLGADAALERYGRIPLPPYLERDEEPEDRERYQTVFARVPGSVAAPTAGLHFTPELLARISGAGVKVTRVTLHVGPGTFRPVEADRVEDHVMHAERWEVPPEAADAVARTQARGGRVWAVGTTVVRTLESAAATDGTIPAGSGETRLFLHPGVPIRVVDGLVTNFHLPRSTLLMLVAAMAGYERTMEAYAQAVAEAYRFYSYGDAMLILPRNDKGGAL